MGEIRYCSSHIIKLEIYEYTVPTCTSTIVSYFALCRSVPVPTVLKTNRARRAWRAFQWRTALSRQESSHYCQWSTTHLNKVTTPSPTVAVPEHFDADPDRLSLWCGFRPRWGPETAETNFFWYTYVRIKNRYLTNALAKKKLQLGLIVR